MPVTSALSSCQLIQSYGRCYDVIVPMCVAILARAQNDTLRSVLDSMGDSDGVDPTVYYSSDGIEPLASLVSAPAGLPLAAARPPCREPPSQAFSDVLAEHSRRLAAPQGGGTRTVGTQTRRLRGIPDLCVLKSFLTMPGDDDADSETVSPVVRSQTSKRRKSKLVDIDQTLDCAIIDRKTEDMNKYGPNLPIDNTMRSHLVPALR